MPSTGWSRTSMPTDGCSCHLSATLSFSRYRLNETDAESVVPPADQNHIDPPVVTPKHGLSPFLNSK